MKIISWNIKSFVSCVKGGLDRRSDPLPITRQSPQFKVLRAILLTFDLIVLYEVPNSANGTSKLAGLVKAMNPAAPAPPTYQAFSVPSGGLGKENDRVAVIWNVTTVNVVNRTAARRGTNFGGGRAPAYFNVTELASGNTRECCAWHAPAPTGPASHLIGSWWHNILQSSENYDRKTGTVQVLTSIVMGDFNSNFANPAGGSLGKRNRAGSFLEKQIEDDNSHGGTTLIPDIMIPPGNTKGYRTASTSLYDQFYVNTIENPTLTVTHVEIYDVLDLLVNDQPPLNGLFTRPYNTLQKAYNFYRSGLSDHLPVELHVTL